MIRLLTWPFALAASLIRLCLSATGRILSFCIGLVICILGVVLCTTIVGLVLGVPMVIFGGGLMVRSIF